MKQEAEHIPGSNLRTAFKGHSYEKGCDIIALNYSLGLN
jgi:hypothetical protein